MGLFDFIFRARRTSHDEKPFDFSVVPDERLVAAAAKDISDASEEELAMQTEYFRRLAKRRQDGERASGSLVHQYRRTVSFDELISLLSAESQAVLSQTIVPSRIGRTTRIAGPLEIFAGEPLQEIQVLRSGDVGFEE
ncbi:MAG TPA: hypothetical protein VHD85_18640, partial [Terracidiphilus sp.]|nr:hypothetical protein [Terracidiphilus sp.]